jgi:TolB-like protein
MQSVPERRWYLAVAAALGVLAAAVALWFIFRQSPATAVAVTDKSIAVLAFANLSDESDNEYFSEGISEELINVLARVPDLKVTARTSAFASPTSSRAASVAPATRFVSPRS